jgi:type III pantothenate kinase
MARRSNGPTRHPTADGAAQPLLTLDRGNSTLDVMLHGAGLHGAGQHGAGLARARLDDDAALAGFLAGSRPRAAVGVTVVPDGLGAAEATLRALGVRLWLVGRDLDCPLRLDYETPSTLGADRWLAALAAHRRHGRALVVDCGSATTVNLIDSDGTFRGGAIAPGLRALQVGMQQVTPHLPAADPARAGPLPARSSVASVHAGVLLSFCGAIERMVADCLAAAPGPATLLITGGQAEHYLRHGRLEFVHAPDLVHEGLSRLAAEAACAC